MAMRASQPRNGDRPTPRTPRAGRSRHRAWLLAAPLLGMMSLMGAGGSVRAQNVVDLAQGKWTTGLIGECRFRYYYWSIRGDTMQFKDQAGQVDVEAIVNVEGNLMEAVTLDSAHRRGTEYEGTRWFYRFSGGGDIVQVSSSRGKRFTLTRCP